MLSARSVRETDAHNVNKHSTRIISLL